MQRFLMLIDGMSGSGKTTTTKLLAKELPRTAIIGMDKVKWFVSDFERVTEDNAIAKAIVFEMAKKYLDLGLSVIIEQPFKLDDEIKEYEDLAQSHSIRCHKFQLFADPEITRTRIQERQKDSENKLPEERIDRNISLFKRRDDLGFIPIDTSNLEKEEVPLLILQKLNS